jgi:hypothetical protein
MPEKEKRPPRVGARLGAHQNLTTLPPYHRERHLNQGPTPIILTHWGPCPSPTETIPAAYPQQCLRRCHTGWELTRWDGWGRVYRWYCRYRYQVPDLLNDLAAGTLADVTLGGGH